MKIKSVFLIVILVAVFAVYPVFAQGEGPKVDPPAFDWMAVTTALQSLLLAILLPLASFAARFFYVRASLEKEKLSAEQQYALDLFLKTCVYAAEQMNLKGFIGDKLTWVISMGEKWLAERGLPLDLDNLRARIESIVMQELTTKKFESQ